MNTVSKHARALSKGARGSMDGLATDTSIDDRNFDIVADNALIPKHIDLRHDMRRERILRLLACLDGSATCWPLSMGVLSRRPVDVVLGHTVSRQRQYWTSRKSAPVDLSLARDIT